MRRILKNSKTVALHRKEYKDMVKFAVTLKNELAENIRNQSSNIEQTKMLLIQSVRDLSHKREQFQEAFY